MLDFLRGLGTPDCPVFSCPPREHVEIRFRRDRFDQLVKCIGLDGMPPTRPFKPSTLDDAARRQMSAAREQNKLRGLSEGIAESDALRFFAPDEQRRWFEVPCA